MRRLLTLTLVVPLLLGCGDRLRANEMLVAGNAGVTVGTPVYDGATLIGRVARMRPVGEHYAVSFRFEPDSAAPASISELQLKTRGLAAPPVFIIAPPPVTPAAGPGGIPGKAPTL